MEAAYLVILVATFLAITGAALFWLRRLYAGRR